MLSILWGNSLHGLDFEAFSLNEPQLFNSKTLWAPQTCNCNWIVSQHTDCTKVRIWYLSCLLYTSNHQFNSHAVPLLQPLCPYAPPVAVQHCSAGQSHHRNQYGCLTTLSMLPSAASMRCQRLPGGMEVMSRVPWSIFEDRARDEWQNFLALPQHHNMRCLRLDLGYSEMKIGQVGNGRLQRLPSREHRSVNSVHWSNGLWIYRLRMWWMNKSKLKNCLWQQKHLPLNKK